MTRLPTQVRPRLIACLLVFLWPLVSSSGGTTAAPAYAVTDLGTLGGDGGEASSINNKGQVAGTASSSLAFSTSNAARPTETPSGSANAAKTAQSPAPLRAFLWQGGKMQALSAPEILCTASGLNDAGQVVGLANFGGVSHGFLWKGDTLLNLGFLPVTLSNQALGDHSAALGDHSEALGVNSSGVVVGYCGILEVSARAWQWRDDVMTPLPLPPGYSISVARGINTQGMIVGTAKNRKGSDHAVLWRNGKMSDLGTLGGSESYAWAINARNQIVGNANTHDEEQHAFLWQAGRMTDLGRLAGFSQGWAFALNNKGQVVGQAGTGRIDANLLPVTRACLWERGKWVDLNTLISRPSIWKLTVANGVNDRGQIVGVGMIRGQRHGFLLTPK